MSARVVLAYSGGLDTSVAIPYLAKMTGGDVVAVSLDLGQGGEDMESVRQRALDCGAVESIGIGYFPPPHYQAFGESGAGIRRHPRLPRLHRQG